MEADEILRRMSRDGVEPNVYTYSTLIDGLAKAAQMDPAETAFAEMRRAKIKPSVVTYNSLLKGVVRGSTDSDRAREVLNRARALFDRMRDDGVAPDLVTYNTLIDACVSANEPTEEMFKVLSALVDAGHRPDVVTYTTLLKHFGKVGDVVAARWLMREMEADANVRVDASARNALVDALAKGGLTREATRAARAMRDDGHAPDASTYGALLDGFARAGDITPDDFLAASVDPIQAFAKPVMAHMNDDHGESTPPSAAEVDWVMRKNALSSPDSMTLQECETVVHTYKSYLKRRPEIERAFSEYDADGDDFLNRAELSRYVACELNGGDAPDDEALDWLVKRVDVGGRSRTRTT